MSRKSRIAGTVVIRLPERYADNLHRARRANNTIDSIKRISDQVDLNRTIHFGRYRCASVRITPFAAEETSVAFFLVGDAISLAV